MSKANITKNEIIDAIYVNCHSDKQEIQKVIDSFMNEIKKSLMEGNTVELRGFGSFVPRLRTRKSGGKNPRTGEPVESKPHFVAAFIPGRELKENLKQLPVLEK